WGSMGVITKPSSVQRSVIVRLLVLCGKAAGCGRDRPPAGASRGSIPQTRPPAQGAVRAAADPARAQKTGVCARPEVWPLAHDAPDPGAQRTMPSGLPSFWRNGSLVLRQRWGTATRDRARAGAHARAPSVDLPQITSPCPFRAVASSLTY